MLHIFYKAPYRGPLSPYRAPMERLLGVFFLVCIVVVGRWWKQWFSYHLWCRTTIWKGICKGSTGAFQGILDKFRFGVWWGLPVHVCLKLLEPLKLRLIDLLHIGHSSVSSFIFKKIKMSSVLCIWGLVEMSMAPRNHCSWLRILQILQNRLRKTLKLGESHGINFSQKTRIGNLGLFISI